MQVLEGVAQPTTDTKSGKQSVKEVGQNFMHRLTRLYETIEFDVVDSARHATEDGR